MTAPPKSLTPKQQRFVEEYLVDLNATQAAIRAGYSKKTAKETGYENLTKPDIQSAVSAAMEERSKRTEVDADWVLKRLARLADATMADFWDLFPHELRGAPDPKIVFQDAPAK